jgi:high-affinity iron transporter
MVPAFVLMIREGLEAALIVGIVAAYLAKIGRRDALPLVWAGVLAAVGLAAVVGVGVVLVVGEMPESVQETLEGLAAVFAVCVLTWMLFWMRRQGRAMKGELERGVDFALSHGGTVALVGLAFVSVTREALETVLFFVSLVSAEGDVAATLIGGLLGLAVAVALGVAIFVGGARIDLRRFFTTTGALLIFVAAGLVAFAISAFGEAGVIANTGTAFDLGGVLSDESPIGAVLNGLVGYRSAPTPLELAGYLLYLVPVLILFLADGKVTLRRRVAAGA